MTTLIYVRYGNGQTHRCDAHCYEAREPECTCICGGKNHGVGLKKAVDNVRTWVDEQIEKIEAQGGWIAEEIRQGKLL